MKLAAVGSNCIDYYNNLDGGKAFPGGGPVNMAVYTVRLGGEAAYIGPVGNDQANRGGPMAHKSGQPGNGGTFHLVINNFVIPESEMGNLVVYCRHLDW